jgi:DNA invertase Pin-like site-specific DNA recombinase
VAAADRRGWALVGLDTAPHPSASSSSEATATVTAAFAPCERRLISTRTKQALARARAQGVQLGRPATISAYAIERIKRERAAGKSLTAIANGLTNDRVPTAQGGQRWYPSTVRHTLNRTT